MVVKKKAPPNKRKPLPKKPAPKKPPMKKNQGKPVRKRRGSKMDRFGRAVNRRKAMLERKKKEKK